MPKVSIIIPVYNRARSILFCLESIDTLHYRDFEAIVVDDGSSDGSSQICKGFCDTHPLFHYVYQENSGVSKARNHGISIAKGEWITFIDSDDAICPDHLNVVEIEKNNIDWIIESFQLIGTVKERIQIHALPKEAFKTTVVTNEPIEYFFKYLPKTGTPMFSTWGKFFKLSTCIQHNVLFNEKISFGEDQLFVSTYAQYVKKLVHYPNVKTYLQLDWGDTHLSGKLRTPEEYMEVLDSNYKAFMALGNSTNQACISFTEHFILTRSIRLVILQYTRRKNRHLYNKKKLNNFIENRIYPYYKNFKCTVNNITFPYMCIYKLIFYHHIKLAILFSQLYNLYNSIKFRFRIK